MQPAEPPHARARARRRPLARRGGARAAPRSTRSAPSGTRSSRADRRTSRSPRHGWISAWLDAFAPAAAPLVLVARGPRRARRSGWPRSSRSGDARRASAASRRRTTTLAGSSGRSARSRRRRWPRSGRTCATGVRWDVLLLRDVPRDGPTSALLEPLARADRHLTGRWESLRTPSSIPLGGAPAEERTSAKFRANLRRRARRLGELGAVAVRRADGPGRGRRRARRASSRSRPRAGRGRAAPRSRSTPRSSGSTRASRGTRPRAAALAIRALTLDGRPVAVHLGMVHRGVYLAARRPRTTRRSGTSRPGQLLQREVLAECEARGLAALRLPRAGHAVEARLGPEHAPTTGSTSTGPRSRAGPCTR